MQNPFRTEAEAFRLLLVTVVAFGLITLASVAGGFWWGIATFIVLSAAAAWFFLRGEPPPAVRAAPTRPHPGERRILVVANEAVGGTALRETIRERSAGAPSRVLVVAPALNDALKHLVSDDDAARAAASRRLEASLARLREAGIDASGEVADPDPLQAIEDGLRTFGADELIIATHPAGRSHWLERGVVAEAEQRFVVPVTHVVVGAAVEQDEVR